MTERLPIIIEYRVDDRASRDLDDISRKVKNTEDAVANTGKKGIFGGMSNSLSGLSKSFSAVSVVAGGFIANEALQFVGRMQEMGSAINATENTFRQLIGTQVEYDSTMNRLRKSTSGVVTDFDLMTGANQLLRMQLATTSDEVVHLIDMAVKLKKPTDTAAEAIDNFSLMLANQSVMRLDSFGISSGKVRDRINELMATGQALNREDAFKMAVMEEGAQAIDRLGDSIEQNISNVDRLSVKLQNIGNDLAQTISNVAEAGAGITNDALTTLDQMILLLDHGLRGDQSNLTAQVNEQNSPADEIDKYQQVMINMTNMRNRQREISNELADASRRSREEAEAEAKIQDSILKAKTALASLVGIGTGAVNRANVMVAHEERMERNKMYREAQARQEYINQLLERARTLAEETTKQSQAFGDNMKSAGVAAQDLAAAVNDAMMGATLKDFSELMDSEGSFQMRGGVEILDAGALEMIQQEYDAFMTEYENFMSNADGNEFVSQSDIDSMTAMADQAEVFRDRAQAAKDAFDNMSLDQLAGVGDGGRLGELLDLVAGQLPEGVDRDEFTRQADLRSGRETELSLGLEEDIATLIATIAEQMGTEAALQASELANEALNVGGMKGLDDASMLDLIRQSIGFDFAGGGDSPFSSMMPTFGMDEEGNRIGLGGEGEGGLMPIEPMQEYADLVQQVKDNVGDTDFVGLGDDIILAKDEVLDLKDELQDLKDANYVVGITLNTTLSGEGAEMMRMFKGMMTQTGGSVPGEDPRVRAGGNAQ